jgi:type 1 glutamine amidotransferase
MIGCEALSMKISRIAAILLAFTVCASSQAQQNQPKKKRLLAIGACKGFQHDSIPYALGTLWKLGNETGLWETYIRTDTELITKQPLKGNNRKNLDYFDAIYFYTTGELDMTDQQKADLLSFVRDDGKGFIGGHSAADTFYKWPEYGDMIGAYFDLHPWHTKVRINVEDRTFPATAHFPPQIEVTDEIYQFKEPYSRDKVRVLMSIDPTSVDLKAKMVKRTDKDWAMVWVKNYGKGRVFFNALGHENQIYDRPDMQKLFVEGVKWAMGMTQGDVTPRPKPTN